MDIIFGVLIAVALAVVTASTVAVLVAEWRGLGTAIRRIRRERRRAAFLAGAGALVYIVGASALLILAPWGRATWIALFATVAVTMVALSVPLVVRGPLADR